MNWRAGWALHQAGCIAHGRRIRSIVSVAVHAPQSTIRRGSTNRHGARTAVKVIWIIAWGMTKLI